MIGCLIAGGLALFAFSRLIHARRWGMGGAAAGGAMAVGTAPLGPRRLGRLWDGYGPDDGDPWGPSFHNDNDRWDGRPLREALFIRSVLRRVNATPDQERAIGSGVDEFRDDMKKLGGGEARRSKQEIADALRRPTFDGVVLGEQFARHDTVIEGARKAFVGLVARVHDTLEPEQRTQLASLVERGPAFRLVAVAR